MNAQTRYVNLNPSPRLQNLISHYWVSFNNSNHVYVALPDGAVDLVIQVRGSSVNSWLYGTTTAQTQISISPNCHYLGIRFKPGQSRHFISASAKDLTDCYVSTQGLLRFSVEQIPEMLMSHNIAQQLDQLLESYVAKQQPQYDKIDDAIALIESNRGVVRIQAVADLFGKSHRQFERIFLETVGISAKLFSTIVRFQQATKLITPPINMPLALVAAELNYSDQSHMSHEFKRLASVSPAQFLQFYRALC